MDHQNTQPAEGPRIPQFGDLVLSQGHEVSLSQLPPEAQLATMRQMLETVFQRMDSLQQNQAVQFAGVHDRLDSVELELPLLQEQSALRLRDLETRVSSQIEDAAKSAVEEASAGLQREVAGKFGSLEAQIEVQRNELDQLRESRKQVESRLSRAVLDIERLCGSLGPRPAEVVYHPPAAEAPASQFKSRIAEHIRKAAVNAAPDESNPLVGDLLQKRSGTEREPVEILSDAAPQPAAPKPAPNHLPVAPAAIHCAPSEVSAAPSIADPNPDAPKAVETAVSGFDDWKRQFMQDGDPLLPSLGHVAGAKAKTVVCPRCFSERTRPATRTKIDGLFRLAGFTPHRCRSCAHRFYKRGTASDESFGDDHGAPRTEEALETR
jgi:hypothetical protein